MNFDKNYLLKILDSPRTTKSLIIRNSLPIRNLQVNLTLMNPSVYEKNLSDFGSTKFEEVYSRILNFPSSWIELSSEYFIKPETLKNRDVSRKDWGFSRKQSNLILNLAENVETIKLRVDCGEFFDSVKGFARDKRREDFNNFLYYSNPLDIGVVRKDYCGNELRLESIFNNVRYSKNP